MGNPESGGPTPEERGEQSDDIFSQLSKETQEKLLALEPFEAEQREVVKGELRESLETLYELLPSDRKLSEVYIEDKLDEAGFKELLPAWRNTLVREIKGGQLHQGTIEEFTSKGLRVLKVHIMFEASGRAVDKWGAEEEQDGE